MITKTDLFLELKSEFYRYLSLDEGRDSTNVTAQELLDWVEERTVKSYETSNVFENYEIKNSDPELHCMDVMMEVLKRNIMMQSQDEVVPRDSEEHEAALRVVTWLKDRVKSLS